MSYFWGKGIRKGRHACRPHLKNTEMKKFQKEHRKDSDIMDNGTIAIIIPLHNAGRYFTPCRRSIDAQTLHGWEVWLVDDHSTDGSWDAARQWAARDSRVHVFRNAANEGCGMARRRAIGLALRHSRAAWYAFIDADDHVSPDFLAVMLDAVRRTGAEAAVCGTVNRDADDAYLGTDIAECDHVTGGERLYRDYMLSGWIKQYNGNKLFARRVMEAVPYSPLRYCEDSATTFRWLWEARSVAVVARAMYHYVHRPGSNSRDGNAPLRKAIDTVACVLVHWRFCREHGFAWMRERLRLFVAPHIAAAVAALDPSSPDYEGVEAARREMFCTD